MNARRVLHCERMLPSISVGVRDQLITECTILIIELRSIPQSSTMDIEVSPYIEDGLLPSASLETHSY